MVCSMIKINWQWIAPGVKRLVVQAGFLPNVCHFQNYYRLPSTPSSSKLQDSPVKWLGIASLSL